jgi:hypothetical protein
VILLCISASPQAFSAGETPKSDGADSASGTPYFTANPGGPYKTWDASATFDRMPSQYITSRWELNHRAGNVPYFSGSCSVTPAGGDNRSPGSFVYLQGFSTCDGAASNTWLPDLRKIENRLNLAILAKF